MPKKTLHLAVSCLSLGLGALLALMWGEGTADAHFFSPCYQASLSNPAPSAPSDINTLFGVGIGPDCQKGTGDDTPAEYNFVTPTISFTPPDWKIPKDADVPDGTQVARLSARATLGLLNNPCNTPVSVDFKLLEGTTDRSNAIDALPPGTPDRLSPLAEDSNANGIPDAADKWPSYLSAIFEGVDLSKLLARSVGVNTRQVPGTTVVLNFLIFEPGTSLKWLKRDLPAVDPRLGHPSLSVLQDPSAPVSDADPVSDFCSPLFTSAGTVGGRTNPADGAYNFVIFAVSQLDADEDGIENFLDPCPLSPDPGWDPRGLRIQDPGDRDGDGLPDSCDPKPDQPSAFPGAGVSFTDEDGDKWMNRNDNCALVPNPDQKDSDGDLIGDVCDPNPNSPDGHFHQQCIVTVVQVGSGGAPAINPQDVQPCNPSAQLPAPGGTPDGQTQPGGEQQRSEDGTGDSGAVGDGSTDTAVLGEEASRSAGAAGGGPAGPTGGPGSGVGALAPAVGSIPAWATVLTGIGGAGVLGAAVAVLRRLLRRS